MSWTPVLPESGVCVASPWAGTSSFVTFWAGGDLEMAPHLMFFKLFLIKTHSRNYDLYHSPVPTHTQTHTQLKGVP